LQSLRRLCFPGTSGFWTFSDNIQEIITRFSESSWIIWWLDSGSSRDRFQRSCTVTRYFTRPLSRLLAKRDPSIAGHASLPGAKQIFHGLRLLEHTPRRGRAKRGRGALCSTPPVSTSSTLAACDVERSEGEQAYKKKETTLLRGYLFKPSTRSAVRITMDRIASA